MIKFLNLELVNSSYKEDMSDVARRVVSSGRYLIGEELEAFEVNFAQYCCTNYSVGVGSGLDALRLIFRAYIELGRLHKGDKVLVPANTYIASVLAITDNELVPVFIEPNPVSFNVGGDELINQDLLDVKAFLAVHLYGRLAIDSSVLDFIKSKKLILIEDGAQSHGASFSGGVSGGIGDAGAHSFYPGKNLGALGDGGAITTNSLELAGVIRAMRNYGSEKKYYNKYQGLNSRLDELQAGFLNVKLKTLNSEIKKRRAIASKYLLGIDNPKIILPSVVGEKQHVWHLFVVRVQNQEDFQKYMDDNGIETMIHYPIPPHKQGCYPEYNHLSLPITEKLSREVVSLPLYPSMPESDIDTIIKVVNRY